MNNIKVNGIKQTYVEPHTKHEIECEFTSDLIPIDDFIEIAPVTKYYTGSIQRPEGNKTFIIGLDEQVLEMLPTKKLTQHIIRALDPNEIRNLRSHYRIKGPIDPKTTIGYAGEIKLDRDGKIQHSVNPSVIEAYNEKVKKEKIKFLKEPSR